MLFGTPGFPTQGFNKRADQAPFLEEFSKHVPPTPFESTSASLNPTTGTGELMEMGEELLHKFKAFGMNLVEGFGSSKPGDATKADQVTTCFSSASSNNLYDTTEFHK